MKRYLLLEVSDGGLATGSVRADIVELEQLIGEGVRDETDPRDWKVGAGQSFGVAVANAVEEALLGA